MRIQKSSLKTARPISAQKSKAVNASSKAKAMEHIKCAINALGADAKGGDSQAKSTIADLSVILFDLK